MRRFVIMLAGLALIPSSIACQHTAGKCDCNPLTPPCARYGLNMGGDAPVVHHTAPPAGKVETHKAVQAMDETPAALPSVGGF